MSVKHFYAWVEFLNSKSDGIVCFEDDVMSGSDEDIARAGQILSTMANINNSCNSRELEMYDFIDLAGGFTFEQMKIEANMQEPTIHQNTPPPSSELKRSMPGM